MFSQLLRQAAFVHKAAERSITETVVLVLGIVDLSFEKAFALLLWYLSHSIVEHSGNDVNSLENRAYFSGGQAVIAAFNLLKSMSFILIILRSVVCPLCFIAAVIKLSFLMASDKFLVHVTKPE